MPTQGHAHAAYNLGLLLWRHDPVRILNRLANKRASSSMWPKDEAKGKQEEEEVQDTRTCTPEGTHPPHSTDVEAA